MKYSIAIFKVFYMSLIKENSKIIAYNLIKLFSIFTNGSRSFSATFPLHDNSQPLLKTWPNVERNQRCTELTIITSTISR